MVSNVCREVDEVEGREGYKKKRNVTDLEEREKLMKKGKEGL